MRYDRIDHLQPEFPVGMLCRLLQVSEAGYYAWRRRPPSPRSQENARLSIEIKLTHERARQSYGPERLQAELAAHGIHAGVNRIKRIRRELGLRCRQKRKFRITTDSRHNLPIAPNLLDRQFVVSAGHHLVQCQMKFSLFNCHSNSLPESETRNMKCMSIDQEAHSSPSVCICCNTNSTAAS